MTLYKIVNDWWSNPLTALYAAAFTGLLLYGTNDDELSIWWYIGVDVFAFILFLVFEGVTQEKLKKLAQFSNE